MSDTNTAPEELARSDTQDHRAGQPASVFRRLDGSVLFYLVLTIVLAAYTLLAFDLEWDTQAGRIGPGYFPRIIGVVGVVLSVVGLVNALRSVAGRRSGPVADTGDGAARYPAVIAIIALGLAGFVTVFIPLGALLTALGFLVLMYFVIDRKRILRRTILSVLFAVALYIIFDVLLGASLPGGITEFF